LRCQAVERRVGGIEGVGHLHSLTGGWRDRN
jgi:hypothetical protein